ncbi:MAG: putative ABC transport system permease protein [Planctomycetota bacterium]|jgi:putative ABC transport system permease protein
MIGAAFEILSLGARSLLRNKLRSFLTMLGMIFGVGSVIAMLSVGAGARHEILSRLSELGVRNVIINSIKPPEDNKAESDEEYKNHYGLTFVDADRLIATLPAIERILRVNRINERVWKGSSRLDATVLGVEPAYLHMFGLEVSRGRTFNQFDSEKREKVCVIRKGLLSQLKTIDDPLGMYLRFGGEYFRIIGILQDEAFKSHTRKALALDGRAQEIYIPYETSMRTFGTVTYVSSAGSSEYSEVELDQVIAVAKSPDNVVDTSRMIKRVLDSEHEKRDYEIVVPLELLAQKERAQKVFQTVMVLIASISLIVGGIGIANIMLATITERTREIGTRRALGARQRDIGTQFLVETTTIAVAGGLIGCLVGILGVQGIVRFTDWKALVEPHYMLVSLGISCAVGILSGIWPARRAARMDPITALRHE